PVLLAGQVRLQQGAVQLVGPGERGAAEALGELDRLLVLEVVLEEQVGGLGGGGQARAVVDDPGEDLDRGGGRGVRRRQGQGLFDQRHALVVEVLLVLGRQGLALFFGLGLGVGGAVVALELVHGSLELGELGLQERRGLVVRRRLRRGRQQGGRGESQQHAHGGSSG